MTINGLINWIIDNKNWLFSGLGITIITLVCLLIWKLWNYISNLNNSTVPEEDIIEMDKLVAPLYSRMGDKDIFMKGAFSYNADNSERNQEISNFWKKIKQNKHLGSPEVRLAIDNYLETKTDTVHDRTEDESYTKAKTKLFKVIIKRYSELGNEYSNFRKKV